MNKNQCKLGYTKKIELSHRVNILRKKTEITNPWGAVPLLLEITVHLNPKFKI